LTFFYKKEKAGGLKNPENFGKGDPITNMEKKKGEIISEAASFQA